MRILPPSIPTFVDDAPNTFISFFPFYSFDDTGLRTFVGYGHRYLDYVLHLQLGNPTR